MPNVLSEYLVRLSFQSDEPALSRFNNVLVQAESQVTRYTGGMTKKVLEAQGAIVGAFTGVSSAIIGMVDKVAMADLSYSKMGVKMLMTKDSARSLDMVTKALGASLEEIWWTPELRERAGDMLGFLGKLNKTLGSDFESNMKGIRDFRFEFSKIEMATKFLGMAFVSDIFKKLFPSGDVLGSISKWLDHFVERIPELANELADYAVPVLKGTWQMLVGLKDVLKEAAVAFTTFVGVFSGDTGIQSATFSFENMAKAIGHIENAMIRFFGWITNAEKLLAHFANGVGLLLSGKFSEAGGEFGAGLSSLTGGSGLLLGGAAGTAAGGLAASIYGGILGIPFGPLGIAAGLGLGGTIGSVGGGLIGAGLGYGAGKLNEAAGGAEAQTSGGPTSNLRTGLLGAIAGVESGGNPNALSVRNNNAGNLMTGGRYNQYATKGAGDQAALAQIDRNIARGLTLNEFFGGKPGVYPGWAPADDGRTPALRGNNPAAYAARVARQLGINPNVPLNQIASVNPAAMTASAAGFRQSVEVGGVSIFITQPGVGAQEIKRAVDEGIASALHRQSQFDVAQLAPAWG